jgi:hypothetical protein
MAHAVDHDLIFSRLVKYQIRIGRDDQSPQASVARKLAGAWMPQQQIDDRLDTRLHMMGAKRRIYANTSSSSAAARRV